MPPFFICVSDAGVAVCICPDLFNFTVFPAIELGTVKVVKLLCCHSNHPFTFLYYGLPSSAYKLPSCADTPKVERFGLIK